MKKILFVVVIVISYCLIDIKGDVIIDTINNNGDINISYDELESGYQYIKEKKEVINLEKIENRKIKFKSSNEFFVFGSFSIDKKTYPYLAYYSNSKLIFERIFNELGIGAGEDFLIDNEKIIILTNTLEKNIYKTTLAKIDYEGKIVAKKEFKGDKDTFGKKVLISDNFYSIFGETSASNFEGNINDTLFSVFQATVYKDDFSECDVNLWGNNTYSRFFDACTIDRNVYILLEVCGVGYFESKYDNRFIVLMETDIQFSQPTYMTYSTEFININKMMINYNGKFCLVTQNTDFSLLFELYGNGLSKKETFTYFDYVLKNKITSFEVYKKEDTLTIFLESENQEEYSYNYTIKDENEVIYEKSYQTENKLEFIFYDNYVINYIENNKLIQNSYLKKNCKDIYINNIKCHSVKVSETSGSYGEKIEIYEARGNDFVIRYLVKEQVDLKVNIKNYGVYDMGVRLEFNAIGYLNGELIESGYEIEKEDKYLLELIGNSGEKEVIYFTVTNLVQDEFKEKVYPDYNIEISKIYSRNESNSTMFENNLKLEKVVVEFDYYYLLVFGIIGVLFGMIMRRKKKCLK